MMDAPSRPAVFLDRDGTLIEDIGYLRDPAQVRILPGVADALSGIGRAGYLRIVITNQSGIGRGLIRQDEFEAAEREFARQLAADGASLDATLHCPHAPDAGCTCRKPGTALHREAAARFGIDLSRSWCVGDRIRDIQPAVELGCRAMLIASQEDGASQDEAAALGALVRPRPRRRDCRTSPVILDGCDVSGRGGGFGRGSNLLALYDALAAMRSPRSCWCCRTGPPRRSTAAMARDIPTHRLADYRRWR